MRWNDEYTILIPVLLFIPTIAQEVKSGFYDGTVIKPMKSSESAVSVITFMCSTQHTHTHTHTHTYTHTCTHTHTHTHAHTQLDYEGVIKPIPSNGSSPSSSPTNDNSDSSGSSSPLPPELPFSVTSIVDHRITLQEGDAVSTHTCTYLPA